MNNTFFPASGLMANFGGRNELTIAGVHVVREIKVEATEKAIINALIAAEDMEGINGNTFFAIPHDRIQEVLKKYSKL